MSTMANAYARTYEKPRRIFAPLMMATRARALAAELNRATLVRPAKCYAPLLSPQKVSDARRHGGDVGGVCVQMLADPANALRVAQHLLGFARSLTLASNRPLTVVLSDETRADSAEDIAQDDLRAHETPETLRAYIEAADEALAKLQAARDAAARRLEELERGES